MARLTNLPEIIRDSPIRRANLCIARNACCRPTIECVPSRSLVELKDLRTVRRQSSCVAVTDILFLHARISHKSDKKGSSISKLDGLSPSDYNFFIIIPGAAKHISSDSQLP